MQIGKIRDVAIWIENEEHRNQLINSLPEKSKENADIFNELGKLSRLIKNYEFSESCFNNSIEIYEKYDHKQGLCKSKINLGNLFLATGNFHKAKEIYNNIANETSHFSELDGLRMMNLATTYYQMGAIQEAKDHYNKAKEILLKSNNTEYLASIIYNIATIKLNERLFDEARDDFIESRNFHQINQNMRGAFICDEQLIKIHLAQGNIEDAIQYAYTCLNDIEDPVKNYRNYSRIGNLIVNHITDKERLEKFKNIALNINPTEIDGIEVFQFQFSILDSMIKSKFELEKILQPITNLIEISKINKDTDSQSILKGLLIRCYYFLNNFQQADIIASEIHSNNKSHIQALIDVVSYELLINRNESAMKLLRKLIKHNFHDENMSYKVEMGYFLGLVLNERFSEINKLLDKFTKSSGNQLIDPIIFLVNHLNSEKYLFSNQLKMDILKFSRLEEISNSYFDKNCLQLHLNSVRSYQFNCNKLPNLCDLKNFIILTIFSWV
ncbi:MAG: tetratricopeptide repeat protein [Candidatus Heimdallarchaeota archaeon]|nr:tetratricopeptide repeat protein [Candidatus Heimdallarchaeota archaeon]